VEQHGGAVGLHKGGGSGTQRLFGVLRARSGASNSGGRTDAVISARRLLSSSMAGSCGVPAAVDSAGMKPAVSIQNQVSSRPSSLGSVASSARRAAVEETEAAAARR
jgi:hypothetical protein